MPLENAAQVSVVLKLLLGHKARLKERQIQRRRRVPFAQDEAITRFPPWLGRIDFEPVQVQREQHFRHAETRSVVQFNPMFFAEFEQHPAVIHTSQPKRRE
jgi:hypothetical protein